jgi:hypothetical protein
MGLFGESADAGRIRGIGGPWRSWLARYLLGGSDQAGLGNYAGV